MPALRFLVSDDDRHHQVLRFGIVAALAVLPTTAVAGSIASVSEQGGVMTVSGSGFGTTGPDIVLFDDFERGPDGAAITLSSPVLGTWSYVHAPADNPARYSSANAHGGAYVARLDADADPTHTDPSATYYNYLSSTFPPTLDVYYSFWYYLPVGDVTPGTGHVDGTNWKFVWLMEDDGGTVNDIISGTVSNPPTYTVMGGNNSGFGTGCEGALYPCGYCTAMTNGVWVRHSAYVHGGSNLDGALEVDEIPFETGPTTDCPDACGSPTKTCRMDKKRYANATIGLDGHSYQRLNINGYNRETPNSHPTYDDVYIATGPGARARVELSSTMTWGDVAHGADLEMSVCTPSAWANDQIQCGVHLGSFAPGATVYVFVVAADGIVSDQDPMTAGAQGFAFVLGAGASSGADAGTNADAGGSNGGGTAGCSAAGDSRDSRGSLAACVLVVLGLRRPRIARRRLL
ncbi:MAG TPA: hypothetical protein VL856_16700 [Acidimicrobiia bacterium]|nr:hypothetical protein [Acidimicrobiia bacterium]